jgi:tRNA G18 (ribose-2'-O)-methylase SpoU
MNRKTWYKKKYEQEIILSRHQAPGAFPLVLILDGLKSGFNVPKIIRTANALGVREIHMIGIGMFDPSPAKGTLKQTRTRPFETFEQSRASLVAEGYTLFALDPRGEEALGLSPLPEKSALVLGHEEYGLSFDPSRYPDVKLLSIKQFGRVESMNVSIAAGMACFEYLRQRGFQRPEAGAVAGLGGKVAAANASMGAAARSNVSLPSATSSA